MKFSTDHYFHIGHAHYTAGKPCQDHALSQSGETTACAIVSDGCSTGGNTDVGSRMLTFGTLTAIRDHAKVSGVALGTAKESITARQRQLLSTVRPMLGLERGDMLATCIYAYVTQNGGLVHIQGDGVVALKLRNKTIIMRRYDWADNTPFYPSYEGSDLEAFMACHGGDPMGTRLNSQIVVCDQHGKYLETEPKPYTLQEGLAGISLEFSPVQLNEIEFIAVFTDGVTQIEELPHGEGRVDWRDAVVEFLAFKSTAGEFAKRRMIKGIKDMQKKGFGPVDDISYAVIHIKHDANEEGV